MCWSYSYALFNEIHKIIIIYVYPLVFIIIIHYTQPCPIVITDTDNTPPVDNYTVNNMGLLLTNITPDTCDYNIQVSEDNIYTVEMSVNNFIGSNKTTAPPFSKFITICEIRLLFFLFSNSYQLA